MIISLVAARSLAILGVAFFDLLCKAAATVYYYTPTAADRQNMARLLIRRLP